MTRLLPRSLQGRLLVLVLGGLMAVWGLTAAMTWQDARHELDELLDSHLAQAAAILVVRQSGDLEGGDHRVTAPSLHRYAPKVAFQVFHEGREVLRSANAPTQPMVAASGPLETGFRTVRLEGTQWRVFTTQGAERDVRVAVGEALDSRQSILWAVLRGTLGPLAAALPLLALAAWWAVRQGVAPLRALGRTLAARQPNALAPVALADAPSEMAPMLAELNGLFERIGALMASERRFTADAAHELRTPIAAIRAQAQVALGEADAALRRHALQATLAGCDRATRVVEQLLTLARLEAAEAGSGAPATAAALAALPVDLAPLARRVVAELAPQALAKGQALELLAEGAHPVRGDATLLAVLLRNLVDNAVRYSPQGASVRVALARQPDGGSALVVEDSGPGLGEAELQRLGERFFRVTGTGEAGSGLGWSIVRRIAAVQQARLAVQRSAALGGLCVQLAWPAAGAAS